MSFSSTERSVNTQISKINETINNWNKLSSESLSTIKNLANHQLKAAKKIQESIVPTLNPIISKQNQEELQLYRKLLVEIEDIKRLLRAQVTKAQVAYKLFKDTIHSAIHEYGESILKNLINNETLFDIDLKLKMMIESLWKEFILRLEVLDFLASDRVLLFNQAQIFVSIWSHQPFIPIPYHNELHDLEDDGY